MARTGASGGRNGRRTRGSSSGGSGLRPPVIQRDQVVTLERFLRTTYRVATGGRILQTPWLRDRPTGPHVVNVFRDQLPARKASGGRVILVMGMVGLDKSAYCRAVAEKARELGAEPVVVNVGERMYALDRSILPGRILRLPPTRLAELRNRVHAEIEALVAAG